MVKVALVVSIIALAVCLLTALHGVLSDGLKAVSYTHLASWPKT